MPFSHSAGMSDYLNQVRLGTKLRQIYARKDVTLKQRSIARHLP
ncbi:hypothetical protein CMMCA001_15730 [Clavibacter michiganensis subsp. michiganensis]|nr:hypothetical protein CMMCA001_15730 [Clavibacter michiganensis subsp. michiganensis]